MGTYTEFFLKCRVKPDISETETMVLNYLFGDGEIILGSNLPDHDFFKCPRWSAIGKSSSHYFIPMAVSKITFDDIANCFLIVSLSNLKNYNNEIGLFIDWLRPLLDEIGGTFIGYVLEEQSNQPEKIIA